jgi:hypothetical protein
MPPAKTLREADNAANPTERALTAGRPALH